MRMLIAVVMVVALGCGGTAEPPAQNAEAVTCDPCPGAVATSVYQVSPAGPGTQSCHCARRPTQVDSPVCDCDKSSPPKCGLCGPGGCAPIMAFSLDPAIYSCAYVQNQWTGFCAAPLPCCSSLHGDGTSVGDVVACACDSAC